MPTAVASTATPGQAQQLLVNDSALIVDVRTPAEFGTAHIDGSINIPLDQVDIHLERIVGSAQGTMLLVCQSGGRAGQAAHKLAQAGHLEVVVLTGGMSEWQSAGLPVKQADSGAEKWALERQVRLVAGSITLTSVLTSAAIPKAKWGAAFIGGGLTFAALSNTCMMGNLLGRLPYNQGSGSDIDAALERLQRPARA